MLWYINFLITFNRSLVNFLTSMANVGRADEHQPEYHRIRIMPINSHPRRVNMGWRDCEAESQDLISPFIACGSQRILYRNSMEMWPPLKVFFTHNSEKRGKKILFSSFLLFCDCFLLWADGKQGKVFMAFCSGLWADVDTWGDVNDFWRVSSCYGDLLVMLPIWLSNPNQSVWR